MTYFKVIKDCGLDGCVPSTNSSDIYSSLSKHKANTDVMDNGQFLTTDGMMYLINNNGVGNIYITVDVNGYQKKPNVLGKDVFTFQIINNNIVPMGAVNTDYPTTANYCKSSTSDTLSGFGCMSNVMQGIDY